jgi:hypothetical protein
MQQTYFWDTPVFNFSWHTKYLFTFSVGVLTPSKQMWRQCLTKAMIASFQILTDSLLLVIITTVVWSKGVQIFQNRMGHPTILGARVVTWSKFHAKEPQILGTTPQSLVAMPAWHLRFVYAWSEVQGVVTNGKNIYIYI